MANHLSALKRVRSSEKRAERNKYYHKTMRNAVRSFRTSDNKKELEGKLNDIVSMIDKLAKKNVIHKNKAANLKSSLYRHLSSLS